MTTNLPTEGAALVRAHSSRQFVGVKADDIPPAWIDDMVSRLFHELNRQIIWAERASKAESDKFGDDYKDDIGRREKSAKILARLQTQLDRLTRLETERAHLRATKNHRTPAENRAAIRLRIMEIIDARGTSEAGGEDQ
jgi:hypothetical protein